MITVNVRLFGAFRKFGERVSFCISPGVSLQDVKEMLKQELKGADPILINDSVIANDNEIVGADTVLTKDCELAILPPVCGG